MRTKTNTINTKQFDALLAIAILDENVCIEIKGPSHETEVIHEMVHISRELMHCLDDNGASIEEVSNCTT